METKKYRFDQVTINHDKKRKPLSAQQRAGMQGDYRYFGAQSVIDHVNDYLFDGEYLLIAEDGENLKSGKQNIAQIVEGKFWLNNHAHIVQTNEICNLRYLCYLLNAMDISGYITGSAQPKLSQSNMNAIELELPDRIIQDKIVEVLHSFDRKIDVNTNINRNLSEQMMVVIREEMNSGSWSEGELGSVLEFYDSMRKPLSSRQRDIMEKNYPYYGATTIVDYVESYIFEGLYILISEDGANVVDQNGVPLTQYTYGKFWVNNHAHIVKGKNSCSEALVLALLKNTNMQSIVTGAAQPKINQANLKGFKCLLPDKDSIIRLNGLLEPMLSMMIENDQENTRLTNLRDSLLPKLMSGELDVSNLEI